MKLRVLKEQKVGPDAGERQRILAQLWADAVAAEGEDGAFVAVYQDYAPENREQYTIRFCVADQENGSIEFQPDFETFKVFPVPTTDARDTTATWQKIAAETAAQQLERTFTQDFEVYEDAATVRIYVAKKQPTFTLSE